MIAPADRLSSISEYYFSQKLEQIRSMNEAGRDVINLGVGSPDLAPSSATIEAAVASLKNPSAHGYTTHRGLPQLREAIANWYLKTYSVGLRAEQEILPLLGSKEGLFYLAQAYLNPGDSALVPDPGYPAYSAVTALAGATAVRYELSEKNNWWPDFAQLETLNLNNVKLMWVNYPHMPTGASGSAELFQTLIDFGKRHNILICHDNPYGMVLNVDPPLSILRFDEKKEIALEMNSFSKAFNMAGWRVGMLLANKSVVDAVLRVKSNVDSGMFLAVQKAAIASLANSEQWHAERNTIYRQRKEYAEKIFTRLGFTFASKQVGLFVWAKAPATILDVSQQVDEILDKAGVFLTPGFIFGAQGRRYARCSLCASKDRLKEALLRIEDKL